MDSTVINSGFSLKPGYSLFLISAVSLSVNVAASAQLISNEAEVSLHQAVRALEPKTMASCPPFSDTFDSSQAECHSLLSNQPFILGFLPEVLASTGVNPWLLIGGAGAGVAAAAAAGGGSGGGGVSSSSSNESTTKGGYSFRIIENTTPGEEAYYDSAEYQNRLDLDVIKAKEGYANIGAMIEAGNTTATQGGQGVTIAILDTGVTINHDDIELNIATCTSAACREHLSIEDPDGHGTHVAGIAAAGKNDTSMHGVAYNANILAGCAYIGGGCYNRPVSDAELMEWSANHGATVANMSYAYMSGNRTLVASDVVGSPVNYADNRLKNYLFGAYGGTDYRQAENALAKGLITVLAAGNHASGDREISQPSVLAIAPLIYADTPLADDLAYQWVAVVNTYNNGNLSSRSHGCGDAAEFCLAAPGTGIYSTYNNSETDYQSLSGTSMAAPQVSGAIALLAGAFPSIELPADNPYASVCNVGSSHYNRAQCHSKAVVNRLFVTATDIGAEGIDPVYGNGLLNLEAATQLVGEPLLLTSSGGVYSLEGNNLIASQAVGSSIAQQLSAIDFIAVDAYDNAGFAYSGDALLGEDYNNSQPRIDAFKYMKRSMFSHQLTTTAINPSMQFHYSLASDDDTELSTGRYQLDYSLSPAQVLSVSYGLGSRKDFSVNSDKSVGVDSLSSSQAFSTPFSYFSNNAHRVNFQHTLTDQLSFGFYFQQGEVSESFSGQTESLPTQSWMLALNSVITDRLQAQLIVGNLDEKNSVVGSHGAGIWEAEDGSDSLLTGINVSYQFSPVVKALFSYYTLTTKADYKQDALAYTEDLKSDSFSAGLMKAGTSEWRYGAFVTQPIRTYSGETTISLPTGYNGQSFTYSRTSLGHDADSQHLEYEVAAGWASSDLPLSAKINLIHISDYGNSAGNNDTIALLTGTFRF